MVDILVMILIITSCYNGEKCIANNIEWIQS